MGRTKAQPVSIVLPAFHAAHAIGRAVESVLRQTHSAWELLIIADDEFDYQKLLGDLGLADTRIRFFATGATGSGSSPTRNIGLDEARYDYVATLDADDLFHPEKLERVLPHLKAHGIVSCGLQISDADLLPLRQVGTQATGSLAASLYKFANLSGDSMLVFDRKICDPRYNASFPCLTDIVFLLRLFEVNFGVFHIGEPLHIYTKQSLSVSNKPGASGLMKQTKIRLMSLLQDGAFPLADPDGVAGMLAFYTHSLDAEQSYGARLAQKPSLLFEDHLEVFLDSKTAGSTASHRRP